MRFKTDIKPKEATFQVVLDALTLTPFYQANLITADVLAIYMQEFWDTVSVHKSSIRFTINKKNVSLNVDIFKEILQHNGDITCLTDVNVDYLHQLWRAFATVIDKCLSGKETGIDKIHQSSAQILWDSQRSSLTTSCQRIWSIFRRNKMFWHTAQDDTMFTPMRCISRHEDTQIWSEDSTVTHTEVSSPFEDLSDIGSSGVIVPCLMMLLVLIWSDHAVEGLESVEVRLLVYKKNESVYEEDIKVLKCEIHLREVAITELRRKLELAKKQKDEIQLTIENFENSSKNLSKLIDFQIVDKCKIGLGYNVVPPPYTGNFMPPKPDLSFSGLEEFMNEPIVSEPTVKKPVVETSEVKASANKPKVVRKNFGPPLLKIGYQIVRMKLSQSLR
ncbi:hypothetical protein Tco_1024688 [Tanacetum coccineum]